jgi:hypothetical protein
LKERYQEGVENEDEDVRSYWINLRKGEDAGN